MKMNFQVGDYAEIEIPEGYFRGEYPSRVVNVFDNRLVLKAPRAAGNLIPLKPGSSLVINICKRDARYIFDSQVLSLDEKEFGLLTLKVPEVIDRKQRRSDVRLSIRIPVELLYFYRGGTPVASHTLNSIDISAGGVRIETPDEFPLHTKLYVAIVLPDSDEEITSYADVVRTGKLPRPEPGSLNNYWASLHFLNMSENKKKKILKFIYKQQELRVKGLI